MFVFGIDIGLVEETEIANIRIARLLQSSNC